MKSRYAIIFALLASSVVFAQKDQIKAAEKAMKNGNAAEALNQLKQAEGSIASAPDAEKAQYYYLKGNVMNDLAKKKMDTSKNLIGAATAYQQLIDVEKASGKTKYSDQVKASMADIKNSLLNNAVDQGNAKNYKGASETLYQVYQLDKTDPEKLYYAANYAVNAQDYDTALGYYNDLKKMNFSGEGTNYYAKNALSDQEEFFGMTAASKADRDSKVKLKLYSNPREEKVPSKKGEIYKNIALILIQKGKTEEAKDAISQARQANPDDATLAVAEANIYLELKDYAMYKKLIGEVLQKNPNDPDLFYNMGVIASKTDTAEAETYYKKAIALKPDYTNAYLNLAIMKLDDEKKIVDEMNKLTTSDKDNKRYEVLKKQREAMFNGSLPYLEKAHQLSPSNADVSNTLLGVYSALEMTDKKKALKAEIGK